MIRVVVFLLLVGLLALGFAWLADRPGDVTIVWLGQRLDTSVMMAVVAMATVAAAAVLLWSVVRALVRTPRRIKDAVADRRDQKGMKAVSMGLIAVGAGDARTARRLSDEAAKVAGEQPLALLLRAQTAQLSGDRVEAERAFQAMATRTDTRLLGLRGLYIEAQRREDAPAAQHYAELAAKAGAVPWARQAALEFRCKAADWTGALALLQNNLKSGLLDKHAYRRQRAVLLTARALAVEESDRAEARSLALEAVKLAPELVPAAVLAGRLTADAGDRRKAARILEAAWRAFPHPDVAEAYAYLRSGDSARDRLGRVEALVREPKGHVEGRLAVARAAIDAREFATARRALEPLMRDMTQRVAMLMAEIEELEHGDEGRAREWMGRALRALRDPIWTADGFTSERWMPVSPVTGRLDAFQWKVPVAEIAAPGAAVAEPLPEPEPEMIEVRPAAPAAPEPEPEPVVEEEKEEAKAEPPPKPEPVVAAPPPRPEPVPAPVLVAANPSPRPAPRPSTVIPLVHAPDDPGPESDLGPAAEAEKRRSLLR